MLLVVFSVLVFVCVRFVAVAAAVCCVCLFLCVLHVCLGVGV